jgi:antitoxin component YwqK of YwqJK toxin-antitoxin module
MKYQKKFIDALTSEGKMDNGFDRLVNAYESGEITVFDSLVEEDFEWYMYNVTSGLESGRKYGDSFCTIVNNVLNGPFEIWDTWNGKRSCEKGAYKDGVLHGPYESNHYNGQQSVSVNFKDGEYHGLYQTWHTNGQLEEKGEFKEGTPEGEHFRWDENGVLLRKSEYVNGLDILFTSTKQVTNQK